MCVCTRVCVCVYVCVGLRERVRVRVNGTKGVCLSYLSADITKDRIETVERYYFLRSTFEKPV